MSFDTLAPHYRWMEFVLAGEKLQRCRTAFLDVIPTPRNILLLGEGHGRGLVECGRRFRHAHITCADASESMLVQARRRWARSATGTAPIEFLHVDLLQELPLTRRPDLIITNFFLDCFQSEQLEQMIRRIGEMASRDACWLIADFQVAGHGLPRLRSRMMLWMMYVSFRRLTGLVAQKLTEPDPFLQPAGFTLHQRLTSEWGLLRSDWWHRLPPARS